MGTSKRALAIAALLGVAAMGGAVLFQPGRALQGTLSAGDAAPFGDDARDGAGLAIDLAEPDARRPLALSAWSEVSAVRAVEGSVAWAEPDGMPARKLDGVLRLEAADGKRQDVAVQDGRWQARYPERARLRLAGGMLAGRLLEPWSQPIELSAGNVLWVRPCRERTLVLTDSDGAEVTAVQICGRANGMEQGRHPGPVDPMEVLVQDRPSPLRLAEEWFDGRALWVTTASHAWRRVEFDDSVGAALEVSLEAGADVTVVLRGQRPASLLSLAVREVDGGGVLFEHPQPGEGPLALTGLPRRNLEFALLRPELGWERPVSMRGVDLADGRPAVVTLDWPAAMDRDAAAQLEGWIELADADLPQDVLTQMRLEIHLVDASGRRSGRKARTVRFEDMRRIHPRDPIWEFRSENLIAGSFALVVRPFGVQVEVVLQPGANHRQVRVGPLARTLLEIVDERGEPFESASLQFAHASDDGARNSGLRLSAERAPDGRGYLVHTLPGRLDVFPGRADRWPAVRSFDVQAGWNHFAMECRSVHRLRLHALRGSAPIPMSNAWWDELSIAPPSEGGAVLGSFRSDLQNGEARCVDLTLNEPGDWRLEFRTLDGRKRRVVADVDPAGSNDLFLDLEPESP